MEKFLFGLVGLALLSLVIVAPPARAQSATDNVRCLLISNAFANNAKDAPAKNLANEAKLFYAGRVSQLPEAQIQAAMATQSKQLNPQNAVSAMTACARRVETALKTIQAVGQRLQTPKR